MKRQRERLPWSGDRDFRILSIDGGGIRGVYPAVLLAGLEQRYPDGQPLARYFDLITGTSTGGIIALGLGAGLRAEDISRLYVERGDLIGAERLMRLDAPMAGRPIELDDWKRSVAELVPAAEQMLEEQGYAVAETFLSAPTEAYRPQAMPAASAAGA
ncbi:MAG: hypothetical protein F4018_15220 [Acidobacteria bacterium]|nr:hypothetical protein [Acidobacteriota bacterium]MYH28292.1 hypothetical protein [Acidobacteriota bacterium]MYK89573.1 hypothetical protein [Acidobacteriota bacterium]